ncbi:MAG: ferritin [Candidatus Thermoplasmatota archaeon]|nr:ferritin [Candidatus Thermoplasmatota archaeon]
MEGRTMLGKKMMEELNKQINEELASAYIYQAMAAYFESEGWKGMALWMEKQAGEEQVHAKKFYDYINARGGRVRFQAIQEPPFSYKSPLDAFSAALKHEQHITARIDLLVDLARKDRDNATEIMLQWFVSEQVEEEEHATDVVEHLKKIKDSTGALFQLDHQLGKRGGD